MPVVFGLKSTEPDDHRVICCSLQAGLGRLIPSRPPAWSNVGRDEFTVKGSQSRSLEVKNMEGRGYCCIEVCSAET